MEQLPPITRLTARSADTASQVGMCNSGCSAALTSARSVRTSMPKAPCPAAGNICSGSKLQRIQGAFITEDEIARITNHWAKQGDPEFEDELLETADDQRTVRRIGKGAEAGSYVCSAGNVTSFATYGNTIAIARSTVTYIKGLKAAAPKAAK